MNIEQIAYEQASGEMLDYFSKQQLAAFLHRCLSKLAENEVEPVAYQSTRNGFIAKENKNHEYNVALYTEAQLIAAQQKVAEACARYCGQTLSPSKTIPDDSGRAWIAGTIHCADGIRNGEWREYL